MPASSILVARYNIKVLYRNKKAFAMWRNREKYLLFSVGLYTAQKSLLKNSNFSPMTCYAP